MSIAPSPARIHLPKLLNPPATILSYLCQRFPQMGEDVWLARVHNRKVHIIDGTLVTASTPYAHGITVSYYREIETEPAVPFREQIVFQNEHLFVVDKPHFLPVTPAGPSVNECLLSRLQKRTGLADIAPMHRLDRDTAGLVLFSTVKTERPTFAKLFTDRQIIRTYLAAAHIHHHTLENPRIGELNQGREWLIENRIGPGDPWFRMKILPGAQNTSTQIVLKQLRGNLALFELRPHTGKKHQLRVHMMSLGFPILNDAYYPDLQQRAQQDYSRPLQLLANTLSFKDPITGEDFSFKSQQTLSLWKVIKRLKKGGSE